MQPLTQTPDPAAFFALGTALLAVRVVLGLYMAAHGAQKLLGWFGGHGVAGSAVFFEQLGFRPARAFVIAASATEVVSGLLVALGLLGPIGPALMVSVMIVAAVSVHWQHGMFAMQNGIELALTFGTAAFALGLTGYGPYSLDAMLGLQPLFTTQFAWAALAVGAAGGVGNLMLRRAPAPISR